ncbi:hypothetical protein ACWDR3_00605 [Streptomyces sp. NPDC001002]
MQRPSVEIDLEGLDEPTAEEVVKLVTDLGGEPRSYDGDMTSFAEVLALVVLVVTPLKPFLDSMLQHAGEVTMQRLMALLPARAQSSVQPTTASSGTPGGAAARAVLDGERGHVFVFRDDAPPPDAFIDALRALAVLDTSALPDDTQWIWDTATARWAALPPDSSVSGSHV